MEMKLLSWRTGTLYTIIILLIGVMIFTLTSTILENETSIAENCRTRNDQIALVNQKLEQLGLVFDLSVETRPETLPPIDPRVIVLFSDFRKPIPLVDCDTLK